MADRHSIYLDGLPHTVPIPNAARVGPLLMSGSISARDPQTREVPDDPGAQFTKLFENIERLMAAAGGSMDDIVMISITVKDRKLREALDPVWLATFPDEHNRPARHVAANPEQNAIQAEVTAYIT